MKTGSFSKTNDQGFHKLVCNHQINNRWGYRMTLMSEFLVRGCSERKRKIVFITLPMKLSMGISKPYDSIALFRAHERRLNPLEPFEPIFSLFEVVFREHIGTF